MWSPQQEAALDAVGHWLKDGDSQTFYLAGYAGTGKTTLAKHLAANAGHVLFGAFTGKAASVLRAKGCDNATTIHRLIYQPKPRGRGKLVELQQELVRKQQQLVDNPDNPFFRAAVRAAERKVQEEAQRARAPLFQRREDSEVAGADLVIIDECSMVGKQMGVDLLQYGTKVLVLGDPAQLPPVGSGGFFTDRTPDVMLTEVHRQARESGILRLATELREGRPFQLCDYGDAEVISRADLNPESVPEYDQVIVGRNRTRRGTNRRMRELLGHTGDVPHIGERIICLRNDHDAGLLNGELWSVLDSCDLGETVGLTIQNGEAQLTVQAHACIFRGEELAHWDHSSDTQEFDWGYTITCHKAQGSQFPRLIVFDESGAFSQDAARWRYTAATRAADQLTVVLT